MKREIGRFAGREFDLLVVGGGITGAIAAWDAAMRGLDVALIERGDFGHATSSASSKLLHGGIRFLQKLQIHLVRESLHERMVFRRIAPHGVRLKQFLVPTSGHGMRGRGLLVPGMLLYEMLGLDLRRPVPGGEAVPFFRVLSRREVLGLEPDLPAAGLTGGVVFPEYHMHNSERMTFAFALSAEREGAAVANYVEAVRFRMEGGRVRGVAARDLAAGDTFDIAARVVLNAGGPWSFENLARLPREAATERFGLSKGVHIVTRPLTRGHAVAIATAHRSESFLTRGGRHFFVIPWRGRSLIGTTDVPHGTTPGRVCATERDIGDFINEINRAWPAAALRRDDVRHFWAGLYPLVGKTVKAGIYQGGGRSRLFDHRRRDGIAGLISGIAAKYTTARRLAVRMVDLAFRELGRPAPATRTDRTPVAGGDTGSVDRFLAEIIAAHGETFGEDVIAELVANHGTKCREILRLAETGEAPGTGTRLAVPLSKNTPTIGAEILHAAREEMALTLSDAVFRRTGLGTIGDPGEEAIARAAAIMAAELGWSEARTADEIAAVRARYMAAVDGSSGGGTATGPEEKRGDAR